jgi:cyclopropane fatty-acyl-phospholipid synthase-like methyltransferase
MNKSTKKVIEYYEHPESKYGYKLFTWDTKHFGYYPSGKSDISEKKAQVNMMDLCAEKLDIRPGDLILDAGCGRGTTSCHFAKKYGANIIGIDIVNFELNIARKIAERMGLSEKVKFMKQDYSKTSFHDNYFDKIFTLETLVHSPDLGATLLELNRILKPGGRFVMFEYSFSDPKNFTEWEDRMINLINEGSAMFSLDKMYHDELPKIVERSGFKIILDEEITKNMLPSLERFDRIATYPYKIIKFFNLQKHFINTTAGVEFYRMVKKGLIRYRIIVSEK